MKEKLTNKQKEAVESSSPSTMVIAGPGTGKTHILASRVEYLVRHMDIPAENILTLTFTKSGANAMKERVIKFLGEDGYKITTSTFHGFASSLFEEFPQEFRFGRNLREATNIDRAKIIENIIDELTESGELKELYSPYDKYHYFNDISRAISHIKKEGISVDEFKKLVAGWQAEFDAMPDEEKLSSRGPRKGKVKREHEKTQKNINKNKELALIYQKYEKEMKNRHLFDYEDMIMRAIEGLEENEGLRHELQERYKAILVDEYQDTSGGQNKLLFLLIPEQNYNIFIVGDDDQAIYRFQGATIENFREFIKKYPDTKIVSLEDNFRSPNLLLNAALNLANKSEKRLTSELGLPDKRLIAHGEFSDSQDIEINEFNTDTEEHSFIVEKILELNKEGTNWGEISVITRTNREQEEISEILRGRGIPVYVSGDTNALDNSYVSSLFALAKACIDPHDNDALLEFLLHPATPIMRDDVWRVLEQKNKVLFSAFRNLLEEDKFSDKASAQKTFDIINELSGSLTVKTG
ncbi:MAG: ATP-dependent helicase, partial [Candidatus Spechtbacterales bacterium]|nr:ATP-dependent helicase [Candidatus Spechtbacterales bacterium]